MAAVVFEWHWLANARSSVWKPYAATLSQNIEAAYWKFAGSGGKFSTFSIDDERYIDFHRFEQIRFDDNSRRRDVRRKEATAREGLLSTEEAIAVHRALHAGDSSIHLRSRVHNIYLQNGVRHSYVEGVLFGVHDPKEQTFFTPAKSSCVTWVKTGDEASWGRVEDDVVTVLCSAIFVESSKHLPPPPPSPPPASLASTPHCTTPVSPRPCGTRVCASSSSSSSNTASSTKHASPSPSPLRRAPSAPTLPCERPTLKRPHSADALGRPTGAHNTPQPAAACLAPCTATATVVLATSSTSGSGGAPASDAAAFSSPTKRPRSASDLSDAAAGAASPVVRVASSAEDGKLYEDEAVAVHNALHNRDVGEVVVRGRAYEISTTSKAKLRQCFPLGIGFMEQNPKKSSTTAQAAQSGERITWVMWGDKFRWGKIQNGRIAKICPALIRGNRPAGLAAPLSSPVRSSSHANNSLSSVSSPPTGSATPAPSSSSGLCSAHKRTASMDLMHRWHIPLSHLQLGPRLGAGAYGEVRKAQFRGASVAVKVLFQNRGSAAASLASQKARASFLAEAQLLCQLRHPNIVAYLGGSASDSCLVMEYLPRSLHDLLHHDCRRPASATSAAPTTAAATTASAAPLPVADVLKIARGIAAGLTYLHSLDPPILHRDLKPGNIMLDENNVPKIADFGISKEAIENDAAMTKIGTPLYSAPEVLLEKRYCAKVDVFSFGILLCEMVSGVVPYSDVPGPHQCGGLSLQLMTKVARQGLRPTIPAHCPDDLALLIADCWQARPTDRPSPDRIICRLDHMMAGRP